MTPAQQITALDTLIMEIHAIGIKMAELKGELENTRLKQIKKTPAEALETYANQCDTDPGGKYSP